MHHTTVSTCFGVLRISCDDVGICEITRIADAEQEAMSPPENEPSNRLLRQARQAVFDFCLGLPDSLSVLPLSIHGTEFQKAVWEQLRTIPFGEVQSYGQIAEKIGKPTASRAVGAACSRNPILLAIPCHRVIGASGQLTGFAGGLPMKSALLEFEKRNEVSPFHYRNQTLPGTSPVAANA